jgi:asparagine synthase (glutamine-hydrolysing)
MAFSIETRLPFLDYRMVNLAFGLSDSAMNNNGWTKFAIRSSIEDIAPKEIIWRKSKMGFPAPTSHFMQDNRRYFAQLFRDNPRSSELVNTLRLAEILEKGQIEDWHWRFISLELWMRQFEISST